MHSASKGTHLFFLLLEQCTCGDGILKSRSGPFLALTKRELLHNVLGHVFSLYFLAFLNYKQVSRSYTDVSKLHYLL